jgi:PAS domain S-box-containing protein
MQIYRNLLEAMPDAIVVGDAAGRIVQANSQAERLFASSRSALIGEPIEQLLSEQCRAQHAEAVARILAHRRVQGTHATLELKALRRDGKEFAARVNLAPLETEMGTCIVCAVRDISERQRLQQSLHNSRRLKSEFFGHMSHELGTPLNGIIGFAEFLLEGKSGPLNEQQRECLDDILGSGRRLLRLISQIMELARVEAGTLELNAQTFALRALIEEACSAAGLAAQNKRVAIHRNVAPGLDAVTLDRERLLQVLDYLLTNAIKFSSEGREIHLSVTAQGDAALCVRIWDSGTVKRSAELEQLFTNYPQADVSAIRRFGGTGLDLVLARRIVEGQNGAFFIESEPGRGSAFTLILPCVITSMSAAAGLSAPL